MKLKTRQTRPTEIWMPFLLRYSPTISRPPPLAPQGTDYQKSVWQALLDIPWGATVTYGDLAKKLGSAPRAVGSAVGRNPISLMIPCHRVGGAKKQLTGYAGGLERKRYLLRLEGSVE